MIKEFTLQTLDSPVIKDLLGRMQRIRPETRALWGRMNAHQMVCHLNDSFSLAMGDKTASEDINVFSRTLIKWVALYAPLRWPKGVPTRPEMDQLREVRAPWNFRMIKPRWPPRSNGSRGSPIPSSSLVIRPSVNSPNGNGFAGVTYTQITTSASSECRRWHFGERRPDCRPPMRKAPGVPWRLRWIIGERESSYRYSLR